MRCPPNCPDRKLHCHATCKTYLRQKTIDVLMRRKQLRENKKYAFFKEEQRAIIAIGRQKAKDRKRHKANEK